MSKLSKQARAAIPASKFAGPNRTYPIPDKNHARAAITGASHAEHVGNISAHEAAVIKATARRMLKK